MQGFQPLVPNLRRSPLRYAFGHHWLTAAATLLLLGCSADQGRRAASRTDSAGVAIVHLASSSADRAPAWTSEAVFSTVALDSLSLGGTLDAAFLPDTNLLIGSGPDLFGLSRDGSAVTRHGRSGEGPGEFRRIFRVGVAADRSVFVGDVWSGRFTQLRIGDSVVRIVSRLTAGTSGREVDPVTVLSDGRILSTLWQWRPNRGSLKGITSGAFERDPVPLLVHDTNGRLTDSIALWPGLERANVSLQGGEARLPVAFARSVVYDGRGNRTVFSVSDSLDLSLYEGTELKLRLTGPGEHRRPTGGELDAWRRALLRTQPDLGPMVIEALQGTPDVPSPPAIGGLVLDDEGNVWVGDYLMPDQRERRWRIYSRGGELVGAIQLPAYHEALLPSRTELLDVFGDRVALLRQTDEGELVVEVRSIRRD